MTSSFLRLKEAASYLGISRQTLWRLGISDPTFPRMIIISARCKGYRREALHEWLKAKEQFDV